MVNKEKSTKNHWTVNQVFKAGDDRKVRTGNWGVTNLEVWAKHDNQPLNNSILGAETLHCRVKFVGVDVAVVVVVVVFVVTVVVSVVINSEVAVRIVINIIPAGIVVFRVVINSVISVRINFVNTMPVGIVVYGVVVVVVVVLVVVRGWWGQGAMLEK